MSGALTLYESWVWRSLIFMTALLIGAGGLGASSSVALIGLLLLPLLVRSAIQDIAARPLVPALFAAALVWTALSLAWSPYERPDQAIKLLVLTPIFAVAAYAAWCLPSNAARRRLNWLTIVFALVALYLLFEALLGLPVSYWVKVNLEGETDPAEAALLADRLMARATTGFALVAGPAAIALWMKGDLAPRAAAGLIAAAALAGGLAFGVVANLAAVVLAAAAAGLVWRWPGKGLGLVFFTSAATILAAPLYMTALLVLVSENGAAQMPWSWHMRVEIWRFALEQIAAAPLFGHGLDAARVMNDEIILRGLPFNRMPLHPHNAGLQIWMETGLIGAVLFSASLSALGWRCWSAAINPARAAALAFSAVAYLVTILVGSGVWQEWLHACLAMGCVAAFMIRR